MVLQPPLKPGYATLLWREIKKAQQRLEMLLAMAALEEDFFTPLPAREQSDATRNARQHHKRGPKLKGTFISCVQCGIRKYVRPSFANQRCCSIKCRTKDLKDRGILGKRRQSMREI